MGGGGIEGSRGVPNIFEKLTTGGRVASVFQEFSRGGVVTRVFQEFSRG